MRQDRIKQYLALRESLLKERADLEARLAEINQVLGSGAAGPLPKAVAAPARVSRARRVRNKISLRAAIRQVTSPKPLNKAEILAAIQKLGYRFATKNPMATLNSVLYSKRQFKNETGRFSPTK
jgi:hypothetical protein